MVNKVIEYARAPTGQSMVMVMIMVMITVMVMVNVIRNGYGYGYGYCCYGYGYGYNLFYRKICIGKVMVNKVVEYARAPTGQSMVNVMRNVYDSFLH